MKLPNQSYMEEIGKTRRKIMKKMIFVVTMLLMSSVCMAQDSEALIGKWDGYAASLDAQTPVTLEKLSDEKFSEALEFRYSQERLNVFSESLAQAQFECFIFESDGKLISRNSNYSKDEILNWKIEGADLNISGDKWLYILKGDDLFLTMDGTLWDTMKPVYLVFKKDHTYVPPQKTESELKTDAAVKRRNELLKMREERSRRRTR